MIIRRAQTEPPTQYWSDDKDYTEDAFEDDFADFECHSNMENPALDESFSPQSGNLRIDPPPVSECAIGVINSSIFLRLVVVEGVTNFLLALDAAFEGVPSSEATGLSSLLL